MADTMRVAVYHDNSDIRLENRPVPDIGPDEVLLRVRASGICGSDVMEWYRVPKAPIVLGHEVAGDIAAVGETRLVMQAGRVVWDAASGSVAGTRLGSTKGGTGERSTV